MIKVDRTKSLDSIVCSGGNLLKEHLRLEELVAEILKKLVKNVPDMPIYDKPDDLLSAYYLDVIRGKAGQLETCSFLFSAVT